METSSFEQKQALFTALYDLHTSGVVHGDARVQNAIMLSNRILWVDFTSVFISQDVFIEVISMLIENDFSVLFESVFSQKPTSAQVEAYMQCVHSKQISAETLLKIFDINI